MECSTVFVGGLSGVFAALGKFVSFMELCFVEKLVDVCKGLRLFWWSYALDQAVVRHELLGQSIQILFVLR